MAGASLLTLLDDIATILDDVAAMSKVAARKTAGVRSGERRVGEGGRSRGAADHLKKKR